MKNYEKLRDYKDAKGRRMVRGGLTYIFIGYDDPKVYWEYRTSIWRLKGFKEISNIVIRSIQRYDDEYNCFEISKLLVYVKNLDKISGRQLIKLDRELKRTFFDRKSESEYRGIHIDYYSHKNELKLFKGFKNV